MMRCSPQNGQLHDSGQNFRHQTTLGVVWLIHRPLGRDKRPVCKFNQISRPQQRVTGAQEFVAMRSNNASICKKSQRLRYDQVPALCPAAMCPSVWSCAVCQKWETTPQLTRPARGRRNIFLSPEPLGPAPQSLNVQVLLSFVSTGHIRERGMQSSRHQGRLVI